MQQLEAYWLWNHLFESREEASTIKIDTKCSNANIGGF